MAVQFPSIFKISNAPCNLSTRRLVLGNLETEALFFFLSFAVAAEPSCEARQIQEASEASALLQTNGPKDVAANLLQTMAPREVRNVLTEAAGFPTIWGESVRIGRESLLFACCLHCGTLVAA